jgi:hypothetical protein
MSEPFETRIWAANYATLVRLYETTEGLELMADVGDQETTVVLDPSAVANLRRALQRYERKIRK